MSLPIKYPESWENLSVSLCHDWLNGMRGGERVLEIFCAGFPEAELFTLLHEPKKVSALINDRKVHRSCLQNIPGFTQKYRYFLPFFPKAIERFVPPKSKLMLSTSHCVAKGIKTDPATFHLCYCFTPMRYAWLFREAYFGSNSLKQKLLAGVLDRLQVWDKEASGRVDHFVAISKHVQARIKAFYGRESDVIYPPADTEFYVPSDAEHQGYDLVVSALVPYKRIDLAIEAYNTLGYPLKVIGEGTEFKKLKALAHENIEFLGYQSNEVIREAYQNCRQLIFPGEEDYGIVPVEAMACGRPVVAYNKGGATETVVSGQTGYFFAEQKPDSLRKAIEISSTTTWDKALIRSHAEHFGIQRFINEMEAMIKIRVNP